jgi:hypothetical protein
MIFRNSFPNTLTYFFRNQFKKIIHINQFLINDGGSKQDVSQLAGFLVLEPNHPKFKFHKLILCFIYGIIHSKLLQFCLISYMPLRFTCDTSELKNM